jgi:thiamine pyrophosphate-dependent acetolactate synthase large subunit-like protein
MSSRKGAEIIVDYLVREGVPYAFGMCGHGDIGLLDALYDRQDEITTISVPHESVAGFMADAFFRVRHVPVATFTSCGPGSAHGLELADGSAVLAELARELGIPVANTPLVKSPGDLAGALEAALSSGRPTVLDVHVDPYAKTPAAATWDLPPLPHPAPSFGWPDEEAVGGLDRHAR